MADRFTEEEIEVFKDVFQEFDKDGDETIDTAELGAVMTELGITCTPTMLHDMISCVGAQAAGSMNFDEFLELMARKTVGEMQEELEDEVDFVDEKITEPEEGQPQIPLRQTTELLRNLKNRLNATMNEENSQDDIKTNDSGQENAPTGIRSESNIGEEKQNTPDKTNTEGDADGEKEDLTISIEENELSAAQQNAAKEVEASEKISLEAAIAVLKEANLLQYSDDWDIESLLSHVEETLEEYEIKLFEEEGYEEIHCDDDEDQSWNDTSQFTVEDAAKIEEDLSTFQFFTAKDSKLAVGSDAFEIHASKHPYNSLPKRTVLPKLTDEAIRSQFGYLGLGLSSIQDRSLMSLAEVITRDAMRPSHEEDDKRSAPLIRHLELQKNYISPTGGIALLKALEVSGCLIHHVDLSHNELGKKSMHLPRLSKDQAGQLNPVLLPMAAGQHLNHKETQGHSKDTCPTCNAWQRERGIGCAVRTLLSGNTPLTTLRVLKLSHNGITDFDVKQIAEGLSENTFLYEIDLSHNDLGAASAVALADMCAENNNLKVLNIGWNKLRTTGTNYLLERGLNQTASLEEVDLSWTGIRDPSPGSTLEGGGKLLGKVLLGAYLRRVNVSHNNIGPDGALVISTALKSNTTLIYLNISHNPLGSNGVRDILKGVRENSTLEELDMTATLAGPNIKDGRAGEEVDIELKETKRKRGLTKQTDPVSGSKLSEQSWQPGEYYRKCCLLYCPKCDIAVRTVRLHDDIEGIDHRLSERKSTDPPSMECNLQCKISQLQCLCCKHIQPLSSYCERCGAQFCDTPCGGIMITYVTQGDHTKLERYPSPPGPDKGYYPDDIPRTFTILGGSGKPQKAAKPSAKKGAKIPTKGDNKKAPTDKKKKKKKK